METRSSANGMVRFARRQKKRAAAGDSPVSAPSTSELKRYYELLFRNFFTAKACRPPPGRDETDSDTTIERKPDTPSCGTRSGAQKKRKAAEDKAAEQANKRRKLINDLLGSVDITESETKVKEGHTRYVERQRIFSVAAHTAWNLYKYFDRLESAASYFTSRKNLRPWNKNSFLFSSRVSS